MDFGEAIQKLRHRSQYQDRRTFASRVGISSEGLRKIENGSRIPERETLENILEVSGCPDDHAQELWAQWNVEQAHKYGVHLPEEFPDVAEVSGAAVAAFSTYLDEVEWDLPEDWREQLQTVVENSIERLLFSS